MWELDHKEGWASKNWCFWTVVLENTLESPLDSMEIKPVNPKQNQPWIFFGSTDAKAKAPVLWPPDAKTRLIGMDSDAGKDWRQEEKEMTEDEMVVWHQWTWVWACSGSWGWNWHAAVHGVSKSQTRLSNWIKRDLNPSCSFLFYGLFVYINGRFSLHFSYGLFSSFLCMTPSCSVVIKTLYHWQMLHFLYACSVISLVTL